MRYRHFKRMKTISSLLLALLLGVTLQAQDEPAAANSQDAEDSLREPIPEATDPIAAKLFATSVKAQGGENRLRSIDTMTSDFTFTKGPVATPMKLYLKAPDKVRTEVTERKLGREYNIYTGFDGETAWVHNYSARKPIPKELGSADKKELQDLTFDTILLDWDERGCVLEYLGPVNSRKQKNYLVKLYHPNGRTEYFYFHDENYLLTRRGQKKLTAGTVVNVDEFYTAYKKIGGVWTPVETEITYGNEVVIKKKFENVEYNVPLADALFEMPTVEEFWLRKSQ